MRMQAIQKIAVVGAGTMGHSIAQVFAQKGYCVSLMDSEERILDGALDLIQGNLRTLSEYGLADLSEIPKILQNISPTTSIEKGCAGADLVVEAIFEDPDLKRSVFAELDRFCPPHAVLASNTSTLNIYDIVKTRRPDKVVIAHWFAPPHIIPLVEVVQGENTSTKTIDFVMTMLKQVGKRPIYIKQFMPGFIVNRIQRGINQSVFEILDNGWATPAEIDNAVKASICIRLPILGPVQTYDFTGLDLLQAICELQGTPAKTLDEKVKKNQLGAKTGKGFYDYQGRSYLEILRKRDSRFLKMLRYLEESDAYKPV